MLFSKYRHRSTEVEDFVLPTTIRQSQIQSRLFDYSISNDLCVEQQSNSSRLWLHHFPRKSRLIEFSWRAIKSRLHFILMTIIGQELGLSALIPRTKTFFIFFTVLCSYVNLGITRFHFSLLLMCLRKNCINKSKGGDILALKFHLIRIRCGPVSVPERLSSRGVVRGEGFKGSWEIVNRGSAMQRGSLPRSKQRWPPTQVLPRQQLQAIFQWNTIYRT